MDAVPTKEDVMRDTQALVAAIHRYSESQRELWQQVPYLALEAVGSKASYADHRNYATAYTNGYWGIRASIMDGHFTVHVDCATGELISVFDPLQRAFDNTILRIAPYIDQLDAAALIDELRRRASELAELNGAERQERRNKMRNELGLEEMYHRRRHYSINTGA